jgi:phosphopentomutase
MSTVERVLLIVIDSVGCGAMPDAAEWGDEGSNTLGNLAKKRGGLALPTMGKLGLGHLTEISGTPPEPNPTGAFGKMAIYSQGKDTMTGHWEMVGIKPEAPFRTYPEGFPPDLIEEFCRRAGVAGVLGNEVASGTEIIQRLGEEHIKTGLPIVYTSADSVFQVAAHEVHFGLDRLYHVCEVARELLQPPHRVGRVIARPFVGEDRATFKRTSNRHDYALVPPHMLLNDIVEAGMSVLAVGKIGDIFTGQGITWGEHTKDNRHGVQMIHDCLDRHEKGLIFANLVDFDMLYGHRRDVEGYAQALIDFDQALGPIMAKLGPKDVLIVTADHGNDPTFKGTDHTREYVPVLLWGEAIKPGAHFGTRPRLADLGATVADLLGVKFTAWGESYAGQVRR